MGLIKTRINRSDSPLRFDSGFETNGDFNLMWVYHDAPDTIPRAYETSNFEYMPFMHSCGGSLRSGSTFCSIRIKTDDSGIKDLSISVPGSKKGNGKLWAYGNDNPNGNTLIVQHTDGYQDMYTGLTECRFSNGTWTVDLPNCNFVPGSSSSVTLIGETPGGNDEVIVGSLNSPTTISLSSSGVYTWPEGSVDVPPADNADHTKVIRGYRVILDDKYDIYDIYDPELHLIEPILELEVNTAGSFEFILPPNHRYYDKVQPYNCLIEVYEDTIQHFIGRPISIEIDYYKQKKVYCEGALNFLKDFILPPGTNPFEVNAEQATAYETDDERELDVKIATSAKNALKGLFESVANRRKNLNSWSIDKSTGQLSTCLYKIRQNSPYLDTPIKVIRTDPRRYSESVPVENIPRSHLATVDSEWYSVKEIEFSSQDTARFGMPYADYIKQMTVGYVTVPGMLTGDRSKLEVASYTTALDLFNNILLDFFGGYIFFHRELPRSEEDGKWQQDYSTGIKVSHTKCLYFDWYKDMPYTCNQTIEFGLNLLDYQEQFNGENFATQIIAYNGQKDDEGREIASTYTTDAAVLYGTIDKAIEFSSAESENELLSMAKQYAEDTQFNASVIECTAADLHPVNENYEPFRIGQMIHCVSVPHLVDKWFPLTKLTIELNKEEGSKQITLGTKPRETLTKVVNSKKYWVGTKTQYEKTVKDNSDEIYFVTE